MLGPLLTQVPPNIGSHRPGDLLDLRQLAWSQRGLDVRTIADVTRLMTMSIADLLDDWFESPQVKGALAVNGVIGTWAGPYEPGTAYVMAHHSIGDVGDGQLGSWGYPEGGMGAVSDGDRALGPRASAPRSAPMHGSPGSWSRDGRVAGRGARRTASELTAPVVVTTLAPEDRVPGSGRPRAEPARRLRHRHRALEDAQRRRQDQPRAGRAAELHRGPEHRAGRAPHRFGRDGARRWSYIERAFQDAREGRPAVAPFSDGVIPTTLDKTLNPEGTHIMSLFTQWVPADWNDEPHTEELEAYADRMIELYDEVAPNFKSSIIHRDVVGPARDGAGVRPDRRQHLPRRAVAGAAVPHAPAPGYADYRTPIAGLYNASSATHAGGGVCGIPGWQAARAALADQKRGSRRVSFAALGRRP